MNFWKNWHPTTINGLQKEQCQERQLELELNSITSLAAQMATLSQQQGKMNVNAIQTNVVCDHCAGNHSSVDC